MRKIINITNGEYCNNYIQNKTNIHSIAFNEAMIGGNKTSDIFSDEFINIRHSYHNITKEMYLEKISPIIDLRKYIDAIKRINLYFGEDSFCQINLLTLLAYLEKINYKGEIYLNLIDDYTFEIIKENILVNLGHYTSLYNDLVVNKQYNNNLEVLSSKAVDLYFDYLNDNGRLATIIKNNKNIDKNKLIIKLLAETKEYGLSNILIEELIEKTK